MDPVKLLLDALEQMGMQRDRASQIIRIVDGPSDFFYRELPCNSTGDPRRECITGERWSIETTVQTLPGGKKRRTIVRIWVVLNTPVVDVINAVARIRYQDPTADVEFLQALRELCYAELWIASRFITHWRYGGEVIDGIPFEFHRREPDSSYNRGGRYFTPPIIREMFRVHGSDFLKSWNDPETRNAMNRMGDVRSAAQICIRELEITCTDDELRLHLPDRTFRTVTRSEFETGSIPGSGISALRWMHGEKFVENVFQFAPVARKTMTRRRP